MESSIQLAQRGARLRRALGVILTPMLAVSVPSAVSAQQSGEVVQPLPPEGVKELNEALRRLARNSRNVAALIDAGNAALKLDDLDAAIGFFGRADELSPGNARVKMGLASAYVRRENPLQALRLFEEAERAGVSSLELAGDRGLAYDLVGDTTRAQVQYRRALTVQRSDALIRRLAISQAIAGDRTAFEESLLPLLKVEDMAAFRARSFGLAILGEDEEAIKIADAIMPRRLARQIAPYLRYMSRLTPAQQAAAAHFGNFPQTAQIGRDDARIAAYTPSGPANTRPSSRVSDTSLAPQGEPLGPRSTTREGGVQVTRTSNGASIRTRPTTPPPGAGPALAAAVASQVQPTPTPSPTPQTDLPRPSISVARAELPPVVAQPAPTPAPTPAPSTVRPSVATAVVQSVPEPAAPKSSVAEAFSNFKLEAGPVAAPPSGGVDITRIKPPIEAAKPKPEPAAEKPAAQPPAKPENPSRIWVQVATGRDRSALRFDWRRLSRKAPELLGKREGFLAKWNQTNRLITGPFENAREARKFVTDLAASDIDAFTFTSSAGEAVDPLP